MITTYNLYIYKCFYHHRIEVYSIRHYKKMLDGGLFPQDKYDFLLDYSDKTDNKKFPKCSKDTLEWKII